MKKLAIITTHPIQYYAPFFKLLTERGKVQVKVFYTWPQAIEGFNDPHFGKQIQWDIPLLEGYEWETVENLAKNPSSKNWNGIDCPTLNNRVKAYNPSVVMVYGWNLKSHFKAMQYFKGKIPVWFFGDSTLLGERPGIKKILRRMWLTWVYRHIDKAFYVGSKNKAYFKAHGLKEDQLVFFPHAVDNERFFDDKEKQYEEKALKWRRKLGYADDDFVLLFAGKLEYRKSPEFLITSILHYNSNSKKNVHLLIIGDGPFLENVKKKARGNSLIKFIGFQNQSDMPIVYRIGDVFYLPSVSETWGLVVNEALSCGRPVIVSSSVGCARDLVKRGLNGYIFKTQNLNDLTNKLALMQENVMSERIKKDNIIRSIQSWNFSRKCDNIENQLISLQ